MYTYIYVCIYIYIYIYTYIYTYRVATTRVGRQLLHSVILRGAVTRLAKLL
jgi:hypothetical protein